MDRSTGKRATLTTLLILKVTPAVLEISFRVTGLESSEPTVYLSFSKPTLPTSGLHVDQFARISVIEWHRPNYSTAFMRQRNSCLRKVH